MKKPNVKLLLCIAALAIAVTAVLLYTSGAGDANYAANTVSLQLYSSARNSAPQLPAVGSGEEEKLYDSLISYLKEAFDIVSLSRLTELARGQVDMSWDKAIGIAKRLSERT